MAYIVKTEIKLTRHEGDTTDIQFIVPDVIDMSQFTEVVFQVRENSLVKNLLVRGGGELVFEKKLSESGISVVGQLVTITVLENDTKGYYGSYGWELEIRNNTTVWTIGRGEYLITNEIVR